MNEEEIRKRMKAVLDSLSADVNSIRTGRATPALVENLEIKVYGGQQKLKVQELATISVSDPQTLIIEPWDLTIIGEIRQGILASNIGLNPVQDGEIIRISLPTLTSEDREAYVKLLRTKLENARVMIRQIRGDYMHDIKEDFENKKISEDERFYQEKCLQEITDEFIEKINEIGKRKEEELTKI